MVPKHTPETLVAIQARLTYLRNRKRTLDELIICLERYTAEEKPVPKRPCGKAWAAGDVRRLSGAA